MTIHLHLGAHKTATTYIQEVLDMNRSRMAAEGLIYWPLLDMRPMVMALYDYRSNPLIRLLRALATRSAPRPKLCQTLDKVENALISDENLIGGAMDSLDSDEFYPRAGANLVRFRKYFPDRPIKVWFCIRNHADFLASSYAESLRHGYRGRVSDFVRENRDVPQRWNRLIATMQSSLGDASFTVWRFRDFDRLRDDLLEAMTGIPKDEILLPSNGDIRPSPSREAVEAQSRALEDNPDDPGLLMLRNEGHYPRSEFPERFAPWPLEVQARMDEVYREDIEAVRGMPFVTFLEPDSDR